MFLLGLVGGVLGDRMHRQRLLSLTQGTNVMSSFILTLLLSTGALQVWHAYMAILITGACWALDTPSRRAVIYDLLGLEGVTNAVALDAVGMNASRMCGPALAGGLITLTGVTGGYVVITSSAALPGRCCGRCASHKGHAQSVASRVPGVICSRAPLCV